LLQDQVVEAVRNHLAVLVRGVPGGDGLAVHVESERSSQSRWVGREAGNREDEGGRLGSGKGPAKGPDQFPALVENFHHFLVAGRRGDRGDGWCHGPRGRGAVGHGRG